MTVRVSRPTLPLSLVSPGELAQVVEIREKDAVRQRLNEMGLTPGAEIRVVKTDPSGALIIAVRQDTRLAIGQDTARKILICLVEAR
ncbi:MAG: ferrous iron transport protein A [Anaerolineae bacterium]|nr:ferrous iron transport protein A [Anaerolineae bacterium]